MARPRERAKELAEQFRVPPHNHDDRYARRDELQDHLDDTADAHDASAISILDTANDFTATDVEGALAELQSDAETDAQALADHLADTADAHDASAISILDTAGDFTATDVEGALAELVDDIAAAKEAAWPVGSVFISVVSTNPGTLLGFGTWEAFATGRTLVGIDSFDPDFDTVEETGGATTHTLTTNEMPAHTHDINVATAAASGAARQHPSAAPTGTFATNSAGGGAAHNNLQPYIVCYIWKRVS